MKSKKSIFVVALAALMLIAFTACEQPANIWNPNGKVPTNAVITQTGDWFVSGQTFDPSRFSVAITYADGSSETVSGTNLVQLDAKGSLGGTSSSNSARNYVLPGDGVKATVGTTTITGNSGITPVNAVGTLNVAAIDSVTITGPAEKTLESGKSTVTLAESEYTVSISYSTPAGKQTMTLDPDDYNLVITKGSGDAAASFGELGQEKYKISANVQFSSDETIKSSDPFAFEVKAYEAPTEWTGKHIYAELVKETESSSFAYIKGGKVSTAMVKVYQTNSDNEDGTTVLDEITTGFTVKPEAAVDAKDNADRFSKTANGGIIVSYVYTDPVTEKIETLTYTTADVTLRDDYPLAISVKSTSTEKAPATNGASHQQLYTSGSIVVYATKWASGIATAEGGDAYTYSADNNPLTITFTPETATNDGTEAAAEKDVSYVVTMKDQYTGSTTFTGSFKEWVDKKTAIGG